MSGHAADGAAAGLVVGAGCSLGCPADELLALIAAVLDEAGAPAAAEIGRASCRERV